MKTKMIILVLLFTACKGQEKESLTSQTEKDSVIEPKGSWNVNKE
jgi:hypothetical protein